MPYKLWMRYDRNPLKSPISTLFLDTESQKTPYICVFCPIPLSICVETSLNLLYPELLPQNIYSGIVFKCFSRNFCISPILLLGKVFWGYAHMAYSACSLGCFLAYSWFLKWLHACRLLERRFRMPWQTGKMVIFAEILPVPPISHKSMS